MDIFYKPETNQLIDNLSQIETHSQKKQIHKMLNKKSFTKLNIIMKEFTHNVTKFHSYDFFYFPSLKCLLSKEVLENQKEN
jgi:hypothetical protein